MSWIHNFIRKLFPSVSILFVVIWLSNLASTDAYFSVYALIAFFSFYLQIRRSDNLQNSYRHICVSCLVISVIFSVLVILANYPLFTQIGDPALIGRSTSIMVNLINSFLSFIGGICVAYPIVQQFFSVYPIHIVPCKYSGKWLPFFIFGSIFTIHLIHLLLVEFPGNVTEDPFTQISEMVSGRYSNFNTYWHTMLFRLILSFGYSIFSDVNWAVASFSIFQLTVMVFSFAHCLMTMIKYGIPKWAVVLSYLLFALIPYHLALSITIWKDVLFAGGCLLILSAWVRILYCLDDRPIYSYILFVLGSLLFFVSRTNGWIIYLVTFAGCLFFARSNKKFLAVMGVLSAIGWMMLNPALSLLNVEEGDLAESLSVPIQQVSRVIADGEELTEEEHELLSRVVDLEEVSTLYTDWISDPMKVEVRSKDYIFFQKNLYEYFSLWLRLGLRYPAEYLKAWVDQTKGYWNAGYDYAMYSETVTDNPYGVEKCNSSNPVSTLFQLYFGLSRHVIFLEPLHSIGLHVWIFLLCLILNIRRRRELWIISMPLLLLLVGMWFGTPVYCCFRYVYPLFVSMPLIVSTSVWKRPNIS